MKTTIEDFETGWFGISMGIKKSEIDILIEGLQSLKSNKTQHFHIVSNYEGQGGIGEIEVYVQDESSQDNTVIDLSPEISPNR